MPFVCSSCSSFLARIARAMGLSILRLLNYIREELLIVAATTSSETVLPRLMQKLQDLGCEESVVGLVIPTGYSLNLDGTCLYLATVVVFLAQATNTPLSWGQELFWSWWRLLTSKGAAGVAGAAFVVLAGTIASVGTIPVASIALVLGNSSPAVGGAHLRQCGGKLSLPRSASRNGSARSIRKCCTRRSGWPPRCRLRPLRNRRAF